MSCVTRHVLLYHGGKWKLAPWIISLMPKHRVYVEPFGGGASVLLRKPRAYAEIYNDVWGDVVNLFRVLRDPAKSARLCELVSLTPFARDEFVDAYDTIGDDDVEIARKMIVRSFFGFSSASVNDNFPTGFRANSQKSGTTPAHDWMNYPKTISAFTQRLAGVVIENRPAVEVIAAADSPDTLFYVDPHYPHETRHEQRTKFAYAHEMATDDHIALAACLKKVRGMVMISGYQCALYDDLFGGWFRVDRNALADGARHRVESVWMNASCEAASPQRRLAL